MKSSTKAVAGIGITLAVMSIIGIFNAAVPNYILFLLLIVYGLRLSGFLIIREAKNPAYRKTLKEASGPEAKMPVFVKAVIWVCVAVLYVAQTSPVFFGIYNGEKSSIAAWSGIGICIAALILLAAYSTVDISQSNLGVLMVQKMEFWTMIISKNMHPICLMARKP